MTPRRRDVSLCDEACGNMTDVNRGVTTDPAASARRWADLDAYYQGHVLAADGAFVCRCGAECSNSALRRADTGFFEAQGNMVGRHYDVRVGDVPLRVLVIPMETGRARTRVSLEARTEEVRVRIGTPWRSWNPHMRGVGLALRIAFGIPLDEDDNKYWLDTGAGPVHVLDAYAMCNLLLCSAVRLDTTTSRSTPVMRSNCSRHLRAAVEILQPTLVISQGATLIKPLNALFEVGKRHSPTLAEASLGDTPFVWAHLRHPTHNWDWMARPYFTDVVVPTLTEARARALG